MVRLLFVLMCGFIFGAVLIEKKQYFSNTVAMPVAFLPDGGEYDGDLLRGEPNGQGRIVWPNGDVFEGEFRKGLFHGRGRHETQDFVYEGDFIRGVATGSGRIRFTDGRVYEGDVVNGLAEGQGILTMADDKYTGTFRNNKFHGPGKLVRATGDVYEGQFQEGLFHGPGRLTMADGKIYAGEFAAGALNGRGEYRDGENRYTGGFNNGLFAGQGEFSNDSVTYSGEFAGGKFHGVGVYKHVDGVEYRGSFDNGVYHGQGSLTSAAERYRGGFEYGFPHGKGVKIYPQPLDGVTEINGVWRYGELVESDHPLMEHDPQKIAEDVLYNQQARLEDLIASVEEQDENHSELYFVGIAGDGSQGVFRREVNYIRNLFDEHYGTRNRSALLINGNVSFSQVPLATVTSIESLLQGVAAKMDPETDILFVYFTGHGSGEFDFALTQQGLELESLSAKKMGEIIQSLPVKHKVVVISACYSGGYLKPVKDNHTLVIVSASADRTSFGCTDAAAMTWFGEAFFRDALLQSESFVSAFDRARDIVRGREAKQGYKNSNPLIFRPKAIVEHLAQWRDGLAEWKRQQNQSIRQ